MKGLTAKQQRVLDVIQSAFHLFGKPPTVREIGREIGVSSSCTVQRHLDALEKKGFIQRPGTYTHRGIVLVGFTCSCGAAPLLPDAAGRPWCRGCAGKWLAEVRL